MIPLIDLHAQRRRLLSRLTLVDRLRAVHEHGRYIMGPEVYELEERLAAFCGAKHAITCASGTDALTLALMALGVGSVHAVMVPSFTFAATAEAVVRAGARPWFCDVLEDTFNIDPDAVTPPVDAVIAVDMFGRPADYARIEPGRGGIIADAAQSFGASYRGAKVGRLADITATSFFPTKPLGCYGDGGCVFTDDDEYAEIVRSLREHGRGADKYDNVRVGLNSRLDTIQAAVLLAKLEIFEEELAARELIAARYGSHLPHGISSTWAQYTIRVQNRDALKAALEAEGIQTAIYYPKPLHHQPAYREYAAPNNCCPVAERLCNEALSLPMHPYLKADDQDRIIDVVRRHVEKLNG